MISPHILPNSGFGTWIEPTYGADVAAATSIGISGKNGAPFTPGSRLEPGRTVRLRGAVTFAAILAAGTTLITLSVGHRPPGAVGFSTRMTDNNNARLVIFSDGTVQINVATSNGSTMYLDGITYTVA